MRYCEFFSIRKSKEAQAELDAQFGSIVAALSERDVVVQSKTDLEPEPKKLSNAVTSCMNGSDSSIFIFANALSSTDSYSFKRLFYELIDRLESALRAEPSPDGTVAKIKVFSLGDMGNGYKGYCFMYRGKLFIALPSAALCGREAAELIVSALSAADEVISANKAEYPGGIAYLPAGIPKGRYADNGTKKKEGFFKSFIPHKGDSKSSKIRKAVVLVAIAAFLGAFIYVINFLVIEPMQNAAISSEIQQIAYSKTDETTENGEALPQQNWKALKKINKEIVGWIRLDGTPIDYPVLWHKQDDQLSQYYLNHNYKKDYDDYGAIFIDYRSKKGTESKNLILHGHNMVNGSMFHELTKYSDSFTPNMKYYKKHPVITLNTPDGDSEWKIISYFKTSTLYEHGEFFNYMQGEFNSDAEFMNFVYNVRIRSMINIPVTVNEDDQILTLSTCSYEFTSFRTVVVARKVRPGEDAGVDASLATVNSSPLYPYVYYSSYGGSRPDPLTFKTAYKKGLISWYDGKGDLKGKEDLTATIEANPTEYTTPDGKVVKLTPGETIPTYYKVVYRNLDGKEFASYNVREGEKVPVPKKKPTYEDSKYTYKFLNWNTDVPGVDFNRLNTALEIYPIYSRTAKAPAVKPTTAPTPTEPEPPTEAPAEEETAEEPESP